MNAHYLLTALAILSSSIALPAGQGGVCQPLPSLSNGSIAYVNNNSVLGEGSLALYNCDGTVRTCQSNGRWSGIVPDCAAFPCCDLVPVSRGAVSYSGGSADQRPVNTVATYTCNTGYTPIGGSIRTCQSDGTWSGSAPTCEVVSCGSPPSIPNGFISSATGTKFGSAVIYSCDSGYTLSGSATITCQASGSWETPPVCDGGNWNTEPTHTDTAVSDGRLPPTLSSRPAFATPTSTPLIGTPQSESSQFVSTGTVVGGVAAVITLMVAVVGVVIVVSLGLKYKRKGSWRNLS